jgi:hypothetical protein
MPISNIVIVVFKMNWNSKECKSRHLEEKKYSNIESWGIELE